MAAAGKSWADLIEELSGEDYFIKPANLNLSKMTISAAAEPAAKLSKAEKAAAAAAEKVAAKAAKIADREALGDDIYNAAKAAFVEKHKGEGALPSFLETKDATNPPQVRIVIGIKIAKMTPEQKEASSIDELIVEYFEEKYKKYVEKVYSKKAKGGARRKRTQRKRLTHRKAKTHRKRKTVHRKRTHRSRKH